MICFTNLGQQVTLSPNDLKFLLLWSSLTCNFPRVPHFNQPPFLVFVKVAARCTAQSWSRCLVASFLRLNKTAYTVTICYQPCMHPGIQMISISRLANTSYPALSHLPTTKSIQFLTIFLVHFPGCGGSSWISCWIRKSFNCATWPRRKGDRPGGADVQIGWLVLVKVRLLDHLTWLIHQQKIGYHGSMTNIASFASWWFQICFATICGMMVRNDKMYVSGVNHDDP